MGPRPARPHKGLSYGGRPCGAALTPTGVPFSSSFTCMLACDNHSHRLHALKHHKRQLCARLCMPGRKSALALWAVSKPAVPSPTHTLAPMCACRIMLFSAAVVQMARHAGHQLAIQSHAQQGTCSIVDAPLGAKPYKTTGWYLRASSSWVARPVRVACSATQMIRTPMQGCEVEPAASPGWPAWGCRLMQGAAQGLGRPTAPGTPLPPLPPPAAGGGLCG